MQKHQYNQIFEMVKTLEEVHSEVKQFFHIGDYRTASALLSDVQQFVLQLRDLIEKLTDNGRQTVALLNQIHKILEDFSGEADKCIKDGRKINERFFKYWYEYCIKIENSVISELKPSKIEVVFFPTKACMWDCLESIWLAAKDDPACDVYVVPIPYNDFTADRNIGQMHYEADQYPDYVPITNWTEYDVEARRPDIIFIHDPYDAANAVTQVHPSFFSAHLQSFTNMLVYVPYFVTFGKTLKRLCMCAGTLYADKVIVQSEEDRQNYIDVFGEWVKASGATNSHPIWHKLSDLEEKFIALGNPKLDKAISINAVDRQIPKEWLSLIESSPKRKKVVLYNTRLTEITSGIENMICKLKSVLNNFKKQDDLVLLWRPHPLSLSALQSMAPRFLEEYMQIVDDYKNAGWGIYDDTEDLYKALALCDGYYGDHSSLTPLCVVAAKPVVIQDVHWTGDGARVRFANFVQDSEGRCWAFELSRDGLFELDFKANTARFVTRSRCLLTVKDKKYSLGVRFIKIHAIGDKIICFPFYSDNIMIYNKATNETELIPLDRSCLNSSDASGFIISNTVEYNEKIYCFSNTTNAVVVFDSRDNSVSYDVNMFSQKDLFKKTDDKLVSPLYMHMSNVSESGEVTLLIRGCEHLIRYSLPTGHVEILSSNINIAAGGYAAFDGIYYWLINDSNDELLRWNADSDELSKYIIPKNKNNPDVKDYIYTGIANFHNMLLLTPGFGNKMLKFDKATGQFSEYNDLPVPHDSGNLILKYEVPKLIGGKQYLFARYNSMMYELDENADIANEFLFKLDSESFEPFFGENFEEVIIPDECSDILYYEYFVADVINFFREITELPIERRKNVGLLSSFSINTDGTAGNAIYKYAKAQILKTLEG